MRDRREYYKQWRKDNQSKIKEYNIIKNRNQYYKNWREKNKDKIKVYINSKEVKDRIKAYIKKPYVNTKRRLQKALRNALNKYTTTGKIYSSSKYGINYKLVIEHLKPFPEDLSKYHIDHIKPLCSFNLEDSEQIKLAFAPKNHQWLLAKDNLKKGGRF